MVVTLIDSLHWRCKLVGFSKPTIQPSPQTVNFFSNLQPAGTLFNNGQDTDVTQSPTCPAPFFLALLHPYFPAPFERKITNSTTHVYFSQWHTSHTTNPRRVNIWPDRWRQRSVVSKPTNRKRVKRPNSLKGGLFFRFWFRKKAVFHTCI